MLEPVLGEGRQISVVDPASEIVPHMPCVNELVGGTAIWQEPSRFPLLTAESKLLKLFQIHQILFSVFNQNLKVLWKVLLRSILVRQEIINQSLYLSQKSIFVPGVF